ncbi:glycine cleavage system aminomethyltransferase GcvT [Hyphococcus flavus]|uniref:aminomethyltransferase n=1 Tax=Hyphococcus flavus TaxID=1866326 RepID=A0AAF0CGK9_9PROT|nr:glycine cleavage system aminomethyltransferase GcvT [Hyphococcus flavus]WDI32308.1 glycine cleavage system aminomethyltransferase GcvT [Hyphococcus flavus]
MPSEATLKKTPLNDLHRALGAKMVEFAGYDMPVQFPMGVLKEHLHTREKAGLFDVSHMGQAVIVGPDHLTAARALETLAPGEFQKLGVSRQRLSVLLNDDGGIIDDLMVSRPDTDGRLNIVVNGACKEADYAYLNERLPDGVKLERFDNRGLLALQGPMASEVLSKHCPAAAELKFMSFAELQIGDIRAVVTRGGYTGEDGFEISTWAEDTEKLARLLLDDPNVEPIGLGARDSLRLEAGMCLYGHDLTPEISPVEGNLSFIIGKRRREEGGFAGADRILKELAEGPKRLRVGILPEGRAPAREGAEIQSVDGKVIGKVTSGGFGPTVGGPVAMGYVETAYAETGTPLQLIVRGKPLAAVVADMPFTPNRYYRG